jgi:plastocyanin
MVRRVKLVISLKLFVVLILTMSSAATLGLTPLSTDTPLANVYGQAGTALQNIKATYAVEIVPGAAQRGNFLHYYPPVIAVPVGTTVAWFNNDPEQPHTVTSGLPNASDSGILFNSGVMPAGVGSFFQYTFNRAGDFTYHCEIHPWRVGVVSVNSAIERGKNFELSLGVGPTWNLSRNVRTLLDFTPLNIVLDQSTPITYNITIFKNKILTPLNNKVFSKTFVVPGDKLPLELIAGAYHPSNLTRAYGPDFSSSGAYHLEGPFLTAPAYYTIRVEIAAINGIQPQNKIMDDFSLRTIT